MKYPLSIDQRTQNSAQNNILKQDEAEQGTWLVKGISVVHKICHFFLDSIKKIVNALIEVLLGPVH